MRMTVGQLMINELLPEDLRDYRRVLDKQGIKALLQEVYDRYPQHYREIVHNLSELGSESVYRSGHSVSISALRDPPGKTRIIARMKSAVAKALRQNVLSDDDARRAAVAEAVQPFLDELKKLVHKDGMDRGNPFSLQVASGSRGNVGGLNSLRGADMLYTDYRDKVIPVPVTHSYSEGLSPAEYWAGAYGARKGLIDTKLATARAGFFGKQVSQAAHTLVVTEYDCGTENGIPVEIGDTDSIGALLSSGAGGFDRNEALTARNLKRIRQQGVDTIMVRSPITCQARRGVCARCSGIRDRGKLPDIGDHVGVSAAQSISERLSQGQLCLGKGTLVRMADWSVCAIEDIRVGDMVLGADATGRTFPVRVVKIHRNGRRRCFKTTFKIGLSRSCTSVVSTRDHKLLCVINKWSCSGQALNGILQVKEIGYKTKDFSAIKPTGFDAGSTMVHEPYALAIGLMLGDGYCKRCEGAMLFSCSDDLLISDLNPILAGLNLRIRRRKGHPLECFIGMIQDDLYTLRGTDGRMAKGYRNPLKVKLDQFGILGCGAPDKVLPATVYDWSNESVAAILTGLFVTDGSVYVNKDQKSRFKPYINFVSTSKRMVDQVQDLLAWRFGIYATRGMTNSGRKRTLYSLLVATHDSIERFHTRVPLLGIKRRKLQQAMDSWIIDKPMKCFRMKRKSIESVGTVETFDLEVAHRDHLFVLANGLIVSNSSKHSSGVVGAGTSVSGFDLINQLIQVPKVFKGGAAVSEIDGRVDEIKDAPQGGKFITVSGTTHYVPPELEPLVKPGQKVEAGDVLSEGIPNPAKIVYHKGIGAGRLYFTNQFRKAFLDSGLPANRRNVEFLARGLINHVRVTDEDAGDDLVPDDLTEYDSLARRYQPRMGFKELATGMAAGKYLERPTLHYSIGTRITPSVIKTLTQHGIRKITVHNDEPSFQPEMRRAMENLTLTPDWQTRLGGFYLSKGLLGAVQRGATSTPEGVSFIPRIAMGRPLYGREKSVKVSPVI